MNMHFWHVSSDEALYKYTLIVIFYCFVLCFLSVTCHHCLKVFHLELMFLSHLQLQQYYCNINELLCSFCVLKSINKACYEKIEFFLFIHFSVLIEINVTFVITDLQLFIPNCSFLLLRCPVAGCSNDIPLNMDDMNYDHSLLKYIQDKDSASNSPKLAKTDASKN